MRRQASEAAASGLRRPAWPIRERPTERTIFCSKSSYACDRQRVACAGLPAAHARDELSRSPLAGDSRPRTGEGAGLVREEMMRG